MNKIKQTVLAVAGVPLLSIGLTSRAQGEVRYASRAVSSCAIAFDSGTAIMTGSVLPIAMEARERTRDDSGWIAFRSDKPTGCAIIFR